MLLTDVSDIFADKQHLYFSQSRLVLTEKQSLRELQQMMRQYSFTAMTKIVYFTFVATVVCHDDLGGLTVGIVCTG